MSPALAGGFFTTEPPGKPGFLTLGSSFGLLLMEKGKKSFVVSYSPGSPLSLSFSPPLLLLILNNKFLLSFPRAVSWSSVTAWFLLPQHGKCSSKFLKRLLIPTMEKEMAAHSSVLAWRILWMEGPGGLQSMRSQRVRHDWATDTHWFLQRYVKIGKMIHFSPTVLPF